MASDSLHCRDTWYRDDFTLCFRNSYILFLIPIAACALSALLLGISVCLLLFKSKSEYDRLPSDEGYHGRPNGGLTNVDPPEVDYNDDVLSTRFLAERPSFTISRTFSEELVSLGILAINIVSLVNRSEHLLPAVAQVSIWSYICILVTIRLASRNSPKTLFKIIWGHTTFLYCFFFMLQTINLRSVLLHPTTDLSQIFGIVTFSLTTILASLALTSPQAEVEVTQQVKEGLDPCREAQASILSLMMFNWADGLIWKGAKKVLDAPDVWDLRQSEYAIRVLRAFRSTKYSYSLTWTLIRHFKFQMLQQILWALGTSLFMFLPVIFLRGILEYIDNPSSTTVSVAWLYVIGLFVGDTVRAVCSNQALYVGRKVCIHLRAIIIGEIYAKALRRKIAVGNTAPVDGEAEEATTDRTEGPQEHASDGAVINLMAVDAFKVAEIGAYLHFLFPEVPVQFVICIFLLYQILGASALAGIVAMLLILPMNYYIASRWGAIQKKLMYTTDKRVHAINEVLQSIRIIKYFAWEERFVDKVDVPRRNELKQLRRRFTLWVLNSMLWVSTPTIITFLSFWGFTAVAKQELTAPIAFTALSLFNLLKFPLDQLTDMMTNVIQTKISLDRVEEFLNEEETSKYTQLKTAYDHEGNPRLGFQNATTTWASRKQVEENNMEAPLSVFQLPEMNVEFAPDQLNVIIGPTGSGKTSLLMALLGEMTLVRGEIFLPCADAREFLHAHPDTRLTESVAYCAQQAWLLNDTIKNNILFSLPFDQERYDSVIMACALERDFKILDGGDRTEVGEKGITLSGGQKQRISLARALYSHSRYVLLDDCLSAVDSHTGKWIFENCIMGPLMVNRTCLLVSHNTSLCVPLARRVIVMANGRVIAQGEPEDVLDAGFLGDDDLLKDSVSRNSSRAPSRVTSFVNSAAAQAATAKRMEAKTDGVDPVEMITGNEGKLVEEEGRSSGRVGWGVYKMYLQACGDWAFWSIVVLTFIATQFSYVSQAWWIREWAKNYRTDDFVAGQHILTTNSPTGSLRQKESVIRAMDHDVNLLYYLGIYGLLGLISTIFAGLREGVVFWGSLHASRHLYNSLTKSIMGARLRFYDSTPLGRIMNRFSKDVEAIDQEVAGTGVLMIGCLLGVVSVVVVISSVTPLFLFAAAAIFLIYAVIVLLYLRTSRELKRLESVSRSPIYGHFGESLVGVTTIRAYRDETRFVKDNLLKIDSNSRPFFYVWVCNRWLTVRVDIFGSLVAFFAGMFVILSLGKIDAGLAGFSLTYAITFSDNALWMVRLYAFNEINMNAVERVREYLHIDQEAPAVVPGNRPPKGWPAEGHVSIENLSLRYSPELPLVIRDITAEIDPCSKIGIVGRTGAGKSTIASAFFRFLEPEDGTIYIDGIDVRKIGLFDLRRAITIIPQDPTLFAGTIRSNLDPFEAFGDETMFEALRRVNLIEPDGIVAAAGDADINTNVFLNLDNHVSEGGANLSQGQRQLMCLARSLLKSPRIILMDEATASIDYETDAKIQQSIRTEFSDSTIITIAHRLRSIIDYDKIMVMDQGRLIEYATPHELLQKSDSMFSQMCQSSGEIDTLERLAMQAYKGRHLKPQEAIAHTTRTMGNEP